MSAEKSPDWLIDLLYDEALEEDEDHLPTPQEDSLTPEQSAELTAHQDLLRALRDATPMFSPQASTRAAILEAAHAQIAKQAEQQAQAVRKPQVARPLQDSMWGRTRTQTVAQIAGLATVLVVGVFMLGRLQDTLPSATRSASPSAEHAAMIAPAPAPTLAAAPQSADFPERSPLEVAAGDAANKGQDTLALREPAKLPDLADRVEGGAPSPPAEEAAPADPEPAAKLPRQEATQALQAASAASGRISGLASSGSVSKEASKEALDDLLADSTPAPIAAKPDADAASDKRADEDGLGFAGENARLQPQEPKLSARTTLETKDLDTRRTLERAPGPPPVAQAPRDEAYAEEAAPDIEERLADKKSSSSFMSPEAPGRAAPAKPSVSAPQAPASSMAKASPKPMPAEAAPAEAAPAAPARRGGVQVNETEAEAQVAVKAEARTEDAARQRAATPSLPALEQALRAERFAEAAREADRFLKTGRGSADERARALEIKAQSYERLGRGDDAYRVYEQLEREYPAYVKKRAVERPSRSLKKKDAAKSEMDAMESY